MKRCRLIDLALLPFIFCVVILRLLGKAFNLTYNQISVVFNLWLQGALLTLSGMAPAAAAVYKLCTSGSALWLAATVLLLAYAAVYIFGFIRMLRHYHLPFDDAFWLCVKDLEELAKKWHTTYEMVNLIIFVLLFLVLSGANIWLAYHITQL
ncbi:MAG: hypothetical protein J5548_07395 [Prevotella sp.]|nr:hypothetical protein [Prevotella sp.]